MTLQLVAGGDAAGSGPMASGPVYQRIAAELKALLADHQAGDKFLTEREIADRFATSRPTANKALASLVAEGLIERRTGSGTYVRERALDYDLRSLVSFTAKCEAMGKIPSTRLVGFDRSGDLPDAARQALELARGAEVFAIRRLRLADGLPVIDEERYVPVARCPGLEARDLDGSIYAAFTERHGIAIGSAHQTIRAISLDPDEAGHLAVAPGSAALCVEATGTTASGRPLWWERTRYRGDAYHFTVRLEPGSGFVPASGQFSQ